MKDLEKDGQLFESHSFTNSNLGEIKTLEIYQNALEFINNKFTKESSTEFKIEDYWYNHITITIKKSKHKGGTGCSGGSNYKIMRIENPFRIHFYYINSV